MTVDSSLPLINILVEKSKDNNKFLDDLTTTVSLYIKNTDWPHSFSNLKGILTDLLDDNDYAADYLVFYTIFEEYYGHILETAPDYLINFFKKFYNLFSYEFSRARAWLENPMSIFKIVTSNSNLNPRDLNEILRFTRADGQYIDFIVNEDTYIFLAEYFMDKLSNNNLSKWNKYRIRNHMYEIAATLEEDTDNEQ